MTRKTEHKKNLALWKAVSFYSLRSQCFIGKGIPIINLRQLSDRLRFIKAIPVPVNRWRLLVNRGPGGKVMGLMTKWDKKSTIIVLPLEKMNSPIAKKLIVCPSPHLPQTVSLMAATLFWLHDTNSCDTIIKTEHGGCWYPGTYLVPGHLQLAWRHRLIDTSGVSVLMNRHDSNSNSRVPVWAIQSLLGPVLPICCFNETLPNTVFFYFHFDGLVQDCSYSSANALESLQSCTKPSIYLFPAPPYLFPWGPAQHCIFYIFIFSSLLHLTYFHVHVMRRRQSCSA